MNGDPLVFLNHIRSTLVYVQVLHKLNQLKKDVSTDLAQLVFENLSLENSTLTEETLTTYLEIVFTKETLR